METIYTITVKRNFVLGAQKISNCNYREEWQMKTVKVAEAHLIKVDGMDRNTYYWADILILEGKIVRIIHKIGLDGFECLMRDQEIWFDDLSLAENGTEVYYNPRFVGSKTVGSLVRMSEEDFANKCRRVIDSVSDYDLKRFYTHLEKGPLRDFVEEKLKKKIEKLKKELQELQDLVSL